MARYYLSFWFKVVKLILLLFHGQPQYPELSQVQSPPAVPNIGKCKHRIWSWSWCCSDVALEEEEDPDWGRLYLQYQHCRSCFLYPAQSELSSSQIVNSFNYPATSLWKRNSLFLSLQWVWPRNELLKECFFWCFFNQNYPQLHGQVKLTINLHWWI